jgi:hypothetical protein
MASCGPARPAATPPQPRARLCGANIFQQDLGGEFLPRVIEDDLRALRAAGANLVQLSVPGTFEPRAREHLDRLVQWATSAELKVVVAFRTAPGRGEGDLTERGDKTRTLYTNAAHREAFARTWRQLALDYAKRTNIAGYDLLVEPHDVHVDAWRATAQLAVDAIRSVDTRTPIIVEAPNWAHASALVSFTPLVGEGLVYGVHQYEPYGYTHEKAPSFTDAELDAPYAAIDAFVVRTGAKVIVNEWGAEVSRPNVDAFFRAQLQRLDARRLDHAVWLWEVSDPSGYRAFDVRSSPVVLKTLREAWRSCTR